jgi:hypothetical protein
MADYPFFDINRKALATASPTEAEKMAGYLPQIEGRLYNTVPAKESYLNVTLPAQGSPGVALFQSTDPEQEVQSWLKAYKLDQQQNHSILLIGFGLGYLAKELIKKIPKNGSLAIIEPDPMVFFTAFCHCDLSALLSDKRVHLVIGQPAEKSVESTGRDLKWQRFLSLPYAYVVSPYMEKRLPDFVQQHSKRWRDSLQRELMYRNTRIENSSQVVANSVANSFAVTQYPGVSSLFYHFRGMPAVLVSAGPSLDDNLEHIKANQHRYILCCVNTAYPVLRRYGIEPHLVITMDHQDRNVMSFQEFAPTENTFLIADPRIHPEIIKRFHPRVFLASWKTTLEVMGEPQPLDRVPVPEKNGNAYYAWLQEQCGAKGDVFGSGSVAVAAFHILCRMGAKQVILAGQDLAYPNQKAYAAGTINDANPKPNSDKNAQRVESTSGDLVGTSEPLYLYKHLLEHEIARFKVPVLNTSSGAVIKGTITTRFTSLDAELPKQIPNVTEMLRTIHQSYQPRFDHIDLQRMLEKSVLQLQELYEDARRRINELPLDWRETIMDDKPQQWVSRLENDVKDIREQHSGAFDMMNELLQESHFKFEDGTWHILQMEKEEDIIKTKLENHVMVLDEFVKQSNVLMSLLEEHISVLDKK